MSPLEAIRLGRVSRGGFRRGTRLLTSAVLLTGTVGCLGDTLYNDEDPEDPTGPNTALTPHRVALTTSVPARVELTDELEATVTWRDDRESGGVVRVGMTAVVLGPAGDTLVAPIVVDSAYSEPRLGQETERFVFTLPNVGDGALPDSVHVELHGFAVNSTAGCAAAITAVEQRLACQPLGDGFVALEAQPTRSEVVITAGRTYTLPAGGHIADAVVAPHAQAPRLFLSNLTNHTVEVLRLDGEPRFEPAIRVGSEPWGVTTNRGGDTILVANSGGTSISYLPIADLPMANDNFGMRLHTPNTVLFELTVRTDTLGAERYESEFYDFSDRPQFIAQDSTGVILYSTVPTVAAGEGTIRLAERRAGWSAPEVQILFTGRAVSGSPNHWSIAHIDSLRVFYDDNRDYVALYDHIPGQPGTFISSDTTEIIDALASLASQGSDISATRGQWVFDEVGFSDTTYVAASGDRGYVAFGEGARAPAGRIIMWEAGNPPGLGPNPRRVSNEISVADLVSNASERVLGVGLNQDGSLGVARGVQGAYFFNTDLRLQGFFRQDMVGGAGATVRGTGLPDMLAFAGTARNSIQILETEHYLPRGEIVIRDNIAGPLKVADPLPGDDPDVIAKLYGVTDAGGVVVVDVRTQDLQ